MNHHHQEVISVRDRANEAEKIPTNYEDRLESVFSRYLFFEKLVRAYSAAFVQFFEQSFQTFLCDFSKSVTVPWPQLRRTLSTLSSTQDDSLMAIVAGIQIIMGGSVDAAAVVAKGTDKLDPLLSSRSFCPKATAVPSSFAAPDADVVCVSVPLARSA